MKGASSIAFGKQMLAGVLILSHITDKKENLFVLSLVSCQANVTGYRLGISYTRTGFYSNLVEY